MDGFHDPNEGRRPKTLEEQAQHKSCISEIFEMAGAGAGVGFLYGTTKLAWENNPATVRDRTGPIARYTARVIGTHVASVAAAGTIFQTVECVAKDIRGKDDGLNSVAGFAAMNMSIGFARNQVARYATASMVGGVAIYVMASNNWSILNYRTDDDAYYLRVMKEAEEAKARDLEQAAARRKAVPQTW